MDIPVDDDIARIVKEQGKPFNREPRKYTTLEILCWALWAENSMETFTMGVEMDGALEWIDHNSEWIDDSNSD